MNLNKTKFIRSAASPKDFPTGDAKRFVFVGRSNVGKSSTINCLVGKKGFAKVSSMPGKTVFVNMFNVEDKAWIIDLPGYGYSKTSKDERARYSALIDKYFECDMENISRIYVIVDIRHKPTADDQTMVEWIRAYNLPMTIVANKLDKLKKSQVQPALDLIRETLLLDEETPLIAFSADKGDGRDALVADMLSVF
ncbi:MAG: YihA family ribosome biogenesis GTP-binding protein [Clostridia bacterium]|nr:YihA family ribosome biogenesis GTP-binding protein [Clostridia bacterium]MBQ3092209.1 YihA family ribosome biogenesis GTP-binding protein [Clostridia bacterium]MBQ9924753.1 YihA family ribosome biogenesis GTP-binding protein [Clostridia bacterium]